MRFAAALLVLLSTGLVFADAPIEIEVEQPVTVTPPSLAPVVVAPVAPEKECSNIGGYAEPALWGDGKTGEFRHGFGIDAGRCTEVGLHVGVRLDVGGLGGFVGGEAELLVGRPGARFAINVTTEQGTYARESLGARLRLSNVWIGADLMRSTPTTMTYGREEPTTTFMFGLGLGGDAGRGFVKGELTALYVGAQVLGAVATH